MLDVNTLETQLKNSISNIIVPAIKECKLAELTESSDIGKEKAEEIANLFDELVSENLAKCIAGAIDYYVKNIQITGTIITAGSPVTQTAVISSTNVPSTNGIIPNTLGIK